MSDDVLAARGAAVDILDAVLRRRVALDDALEAHPELRRIDSRDRAFARLLVATVLRRLGQLDGLIRTALDRPKALQEGGAQQLLRIGAAQILFLGTPPHAAVDTSVSLAQRRWPGIKGLVNAVLRRIGREGPAIVSGQDAARVNTPDWLWHSWSRAYGTATAQRIAEANLSEAPLDLSVKRNAEDWARRLDASVLPTGTLRREPGGSVPSLPGYDEGEWWVQDLAASLPAKLFGDVSGKAVIDLCAAPGGKAAQLAAAGARVVAVDRSAGRLNRVRQNLERLQLSAELVEADAAQWRPAELADAVLLDAPCSATGAIRRHPDIPHLKTPDDVSKLAALQARLLTNASAMLRPGGALIYCTCSIEREEGEAQIDRLLNRGLPVERAPIAPEEVGGFTEIINARGEIRSLPHHLSDIGGLDGFFIARFRRV